MKVSLEIDEWYPMFSISAAEGNLMIEISPEELYTIWILDNLFEEQQQFLSSLDPCRRA